MFASMVSRKGENAAEFTEDGHVTLSKSMVELTGVAWPAFPQNFFLSGTSGGKLECFRLEVAIPARTAAAWAAVGLVFG